MTKTDIVIVAVKIFGLYYVTQLIKHIIEFIYMLSGSGSFYEGADLMFFYGGMFFTLIVEGAIAYTAIFRSELIVSRIIKQNTAPVRLETDKTDLLEIALAVIGVVAATFAIPEILGQIVEMVYFRDSAVLESWARDARNQFFIAAFTLSVGIFLVMNARNFAEKIVKSGKPEDEGG